MFKQSNNFKTTILATLLVASFALPHVSMAASRDSAPAQRTKINFCSAVDAFAAKMQKDMKENVSRYSSKEAEKQNALDAKLAKQDAERQNTRFTWDNSRDKVYAHLRDSASTEVQKTAIDKFKIAIDIAVEVRRKSVDTATVNFKNDVDKGVKNRKKVIESAIAGFNTASNNALLNAKADCESGKVPAEARTRYIASLESARKALEVSLAGIKTNSSLKQLVTQRQNAIEQAAIDFKNAVTKAEEELKTAFPDV